MESINVDAHNTNNVDDEELSQLLDSALTDFDKRKKTTDDDLDELMNNFDRESIQKTASNFNEMLEKMAKETQTTPVPAEPTTSGDVNLMETINRFLQETKDIIDAPDEKAFMNAFQNMDEKNPMMDDIMGAILHTALSRELMYPAVKEMHDRFGAYLRDKSDSIDAEQLKQFSAQYKIIGELRKEYEVNDDQSMSTSSASTSSSMGSEQRSTRIAGLWVELQNAGLPPPEIADGLSDSVFAGDSPNGTAAGGLPSDACSIM